MLPTIGDAERAAELAGRVVDRRPEVRALGRQRAHDRLGRGRARRGPCRRPSAPSRRRAGRSRCPSVIVAATARPGGEQQHPGGRRPACVPSRATSVDESGAVTIIAPAYGSMRTPAAEGEKPSTNCRYWVERNRNPKSAKNSTMIVALAAVKRGFAEEPHIEHRLGGAPAARRRTRRARRRRPRRAPRTGADAQPSPGASMTAHTSATSPAPESAAPAQSMPRRRRVARLRQQPRPGDERRQRTAGR